MLLRWWYAHCCAHLGLGSAGLNFAILDDKSLLTWKYNHTNSSTWSFVINFPYFLSYSLTFFEPLSRCGLVSAIAIASIVGKLGHVGWVNILGFVLSWWVGFLISYLCQLSLVLPLFPPYGTLYFCRSFSCRTYYSRPYSCRTFSYMCKSV